MTMFKLVVTAPSAPKRVTEILIKGATLEDALKGAEVKVYSMKRTVEPQTYITREGYERHYKRIFYRRYCVRMVNLEIL